MIIKAPGEKLGMSIKGGARNVPAGPMDRSDEGIFISRVCTRNNFSVVSSLFKGINGFVNIFVFWSFVM